MSIKYQIKQNLFTLRDVETFSLLKKNEVDILFSIPTNTMINLEHNI